MKIDWTSIISTTSIGQMGDPVYPYDELFGEPEKVKEAVEKMQAMLYERRANEEYHPVPGIA